MIPFYASIMNFGLCILEVETTTQIRVWNFKFEMRTRNRNKQKKRKLTWTHLGRITSLLGPLTPLLLAQLTFSPAPSPLPAACRALTIEPHWQALILARWSRLEDAGWRVPCGSLTLPLACVFSSLTCGTNLSSPSSPRGAALAERRNRRRRRSRRPFPLLLGLPAIAAIKPEFPLRGES